jgi:hypothetical protein
MEPGLDAAAIREEDNTIEQHAEEGTAQFIIRERTNTEQQQQRRKRIGPLTGLESCRVIDRSDTLGHRTLGSELQSHVPTKFNNFLLLLNGDPTRG